MKKLLLTILILSSFVGIGIASWQVVVHYNSTSVEPEVEVSDEWLTTNELISVNQIKVFK